MKEIGLMISRKEKGKKFGLMAHSMLEIIKMGKNAVLVNSAGLMVLFMKGSFMIIILMEKVINY